MSLKSFRILIFASLSFIFANVLLAQNASRLSTESLGAKALLEELLAKRFENDLATRIQRDSFNLGAQLELSANNTNQAPKQEEPISDLALGSLDPEELIKKFTNTYDNGSIMSFLDKYSIRRVAISVGLKSGLPEESKAEVEKWLNDRLKAEFGNIGKGTVSVIKSPTSEPEKGLSFWQRLERLQDLAGQIVMALAIIAGLFLWKVLSNPASKSGDEAGDVTNVNLELPEAGKGGNGAGGGLTKLEESQIALANEKINEYTQKIREIVPRLSVDFEKLIQSWCQTGDEGLNRLACFAEAVGKDIGRLPIPVDSISDLTKVFASMASLNVVEKKRILEIAYWDAMSVLNLGPDAINQPFSYLGALTPDRVKQVLVDQNPRLKSIVSYYLPPELRKSYLKDLSAESKKELLQSAGQLMEVNASEIQGFNTELKSQFKGDTAGKVVSLAQSVARLVETFTAVEEIVLLASSAGPAFDHFKKTVPTIGFLHQWTTKGLETVLGQATTDEVVDYLRLKPECTEHFLALCPPLTATMVKDELSLPDTRSESAKNESLERLKNRIIELVQAKEINLDEVFTDSAAANSEAKAA